MLTEQQMWTRKTGWVSRSDNNLKRSAQLVFLFGDSALLKDRGQFEQIHSFYPNAYIIGCSTAGEIAGVQVFDNSLGFLWSGPARDPFKGKYSIRVR